MMKLNISLVSYQINDFIQNFDFLIKIVTKIISKCHIYLREQFGPSSVFLREIKRFVKLYDELVKYFKNKGEIEAEKANIGNTLTKKTIKKNGKIIDDKNNEKMKLNQVKAIIVSAYLNYYIRLSNKGTNEKDKRSMFQNKIIRENLQELSNYYSKKK